MSDSIVVARRDNLIDLVNPLGREWIDFLAVILGSAVLALLSQVVIKLPFSVVPVTGQTLGVLIIGATFGAKRAALTTMLYLVEGVLGLPVFAGGAFGVIRIWGPTGGYLIGFVIASGMMGFLANRGLDKRFYSAIPLFLIGHLIVFAVGVTWLAQFIGFEQAIYQGVLPFIPGAIVKTVMAAMLTPQLWKWVNYEYKK